jgi:hypothetical protein
MDLMIRHEYGVCNYMLQLALHDYRVVPLFTVCRLEEDLLARLGSPPLNYSETEYSVDSPIRPLLWTIDRLSVHHLRLLAVIIC